MAETRSQAGMHRYSEDFVAQVCHTALRRFWMLTGGEPAWPHWHDLTDEEREAAREAVRLARAGTLPDRAGTFRDRDASQLAYQIVVALTAVAT
jgi:hypothetical protein